VTASKPEASLISVGSLNAVPKKLTPGDDFRPAAATQS
jgi:hypothetical protein